MADKTYSVAGYYGGNAPASNTAVANTARDVMLNSIEEIRSVIGKTELIMIGDFGTGNGSASIPLLHDCIAKVKEVFGNDQQVQIVYEDQAENDFTQIFTQLKEATSYQSMMPNVFVSSVGRTYFQQCLPSNSLDLGFSVMCMHFLSTLPCGITGGILHHQATDEFEREAFRLQAEKDWEQILLHRAAEMKSGARFVSVQICTDDDGSYSGNTNDEKGSLYKCIQTCLDRMQSERKITADESQHTALKMYYRTLDEFSAPFKDESSLVRKAGLNLISIKSVGVLCKYRQEWLSNSLDAKAFSQKLVYGGIRPWSNYTFFAGLSQERSLEERREIVDKFYEYFVEEVAKDPSSYALSHRHAHVVFSKK